MESDIKPHPAIVLAQEIICSLSEADAHVLEEELAEGVLDLERSVLCQTLLETWSAIKQGETVEQCEALGLALVIQQMEIASLYDDGLPDGENDDDGESWKN